MVRKKIRRLPYLDKSLRDLPDEEWKTIPDFGKSYMVSSYGRIKSLARIINYKKGADRHRKEQILSAGLVRSFNYYMGDFTCVLNITLWWEGIKKTFSIRRLVYHCFVESIDLFDYNIRILCKDGNGLNLFYGNLEKATSTQQQQRIYDQQRSVSCFAYLDMENRVKNRKTTQVTQYDLAGNKVAVYPGIKLAADLTGISKKSIGGAVQGRLLKGGDYIWRYGDGPGTITVDNLGKGRLIAAAKRQQKVTQYNLKGEAIATYNSLTEASDRTGVVCSAISKCINGQLHSAKGFVWKAGTGRKKISEKLIMHREKFFALRQKKVSQYTLDGKYLTSFQSIRMAARTVGVHESSISAVVRGKSTHSAGYYWKYKNPANS